MPRKSYVVREADHRAICGVTFALLLENGDVVSGALKMHARYVARILFVFIYGGRAVVWTVEELLSVSIIKGRAAVKTVAEAVSASICD